MTNVKITYIHALSPLHAGTGQGIGVIDLPIARERSTNLPYLPGSSLKGVLRDHCLDESVCKRVFGAESSERELYAGSLQLTDQRLLLMPVRSLAGTFAWATSPLILTRFKRDLDGAGQSSPALPSKPNCNQIFVTAGSKLEMNKKVYLEDLDLNAEKNDCLTEWAKWLGERVFEKDDTWKKMLSERLALLSDDIFNFIVSTATQVTARIKMDSKTKTVSKGGLWYEEALPAETILSGMAVATEVKSRKDEVFDTLREIIKKPVQLGGKATVGRGLCRVMLSEEVEQ